MIIIMLGAPGTGKGTVGKLLSEELGIVHISSGEIFRNYIKKHDELGKKAEEYISKGNLVPDNLTIDLVGKRLEEPDTEKGMILDGFPRNINQAKALKEKLEKQGKKITATIELNLSDKEIINRITKRLTCPNKKCREIYNLEFKPPKKENICDKCGTPLIKRVDDNEIAVKQRLKIYHEVSEELINFYKKENILYTVMLNDNSPRTSKEIAEEIKKYIRKINRK